MEGQSKRKVETAIRGLEQTRKAGNVQVGGESPFGLRRQRKASTVKPYKKLRGESQKLGEI